MRRCLLLALSLVPFAAFSPRIAAEPADAAAQVAGDARLKPLRTLNDEYRPWQPPGSREEWEREAQSIREQLLVSNGLWPMPPKTPLKPVVHGKIDRGDYTVEKVFFASHPGHYVAGNLYRPKEIDGKVPGVLCPHGHWPNGRFHDAGAKAAQDLASGAEDHLAGARYPLQARMVQLARMGCIVFHYDMVGYADSQQIEHRAGFTDAAAGLWLQNFMGLQTWNSIRALDFLLSLPDVDPERIGVTGASGGGTQTFMLCALDSRPAVAFPAVMVSTAMQGGCICENAEYLRLGINNVAIAALFAPKPMALSGAHDWTINIESRGLPELRQVYGFYDSPGLVHARCFPQFSHNYNQRSREVMYAWFGEHLGLGDGAIDEEDFWPIPPDELSVFDEKHPRPEDAKSAEQLREYLTEVSREQFEELLPTSAEDLAEYRRVVGTAARVMLDSGVPDSAEIEGGADEVETSEAGLEITRGTLGRKGAGEGIPFVVLRPENFDGRVVLWIDERGSACLFDQERPNAVVRTLLEAGTAVASGDVFLTGAFLADGREPTIPVDERYQGYTFGYNRPVLANRVRDILTLVGYAAGQEGVKSVDLAGTGAASSWALLARGLAGDQVRKTVADLHGFHFGTVEQTSDPMFLPGALKYGDIGGLAALAAPGELMVFGTAEIPEGALEPLTAVYRATGGRLHINEGPLTSETALEFLLR